MRAACINQVYVLLLAYPAHYDFCQVRWVETKQEYPVGCNACNDDADPAAIHVPSCNIALASTRNVLPTKVVKKRQGQASRQMAFAPRLR